MFLLLPRHPWIRRNSMWERASLSSLLSCHCHLWLRYWRTFSGCSHHHHHPPRKLFLSIYFDFLFALQSRFLVLLYQLKICN
jgi:hypothetical protein